MLLQIALFRFEALDRLGPCAIHRKSLAPVHAKYAMGDLFVAHS
jgi:hypothetical protein